LTRYVLATRQAFPKLHGFAAQKTELFIITAFRMWRILDLDEVEVLRSERLRDD
jgi:hypothetical protein